VKSPASVICIALVLAAGTHQATPQTSTQSLTVTPVALDFGSQPVGTIAQPKTATLSNTSASEVPIAGILAAGIDFDQTNNCGAALAAGSQCTIQVTFKPATTGPRIGNLTIVVSAAPKPLMIALNGTGE